MLKSVSVRHTDKTESMKKKKEEEKSVPECVREMKWDNHPWRLKQRL